MKFSIDPSIQKVPFYPKAALYGADAGWTLLSSNENPLSPSPKVVEGIVNALFDINRYPESEFELKSLIAQERGVKPQNVVIGNGSNEIIEASLRAARLPGRSKVIVPSPSFAFYPIAASVYGYRAEAVPCRSRISSTSIKSPLSLNASGAIKSAISSSRGAAAWARCAKAQEKARRCPETSILLVIACATLLPR